MKTRLLTFLLLFSTIILYSEELNLTGLDWVFTLGTEFKGATGEMSFNGEGDNRIITTVSDFSKGGNYTGIILNLDTPQELQSLSFEINSPAKHVAIQVVDSKDQTFVRFMPISGALNQFRTITTNRFYIAHEPTSARWGGPNDGVIRPPFKQIIIRTLGSSAGDKTKPQTIKIKNIIADIKAPKTPEIYSPESEFFQLNLGGEFPGAKGKIEYSDNEVTVFSDFSEGGNYIGTFLDFPKGIDATALNFKIKTPFPKIIIQVQDKTGQTIHQTISLSGNKDVWQEINVPKLFSPGSGSFGHWGGANDGILTLPIDKITIRWLTAVAPNLKTFSTSIKEFKINSLSKVAPLEFKVAAQVVDPASLIVTPGGKAPLVKLNRKVPFSKLDYCLRDYSGTEISRGELTVIDQMYVNLPVPEKQGFYEFEVANFKELIGLIVMPSYEGKIDNFFAMDCAMSVFPIFTDIKMADSYLKILKHAGINNVRERFIWRLVEEKGPGIFDFDQLKSDELRQIANKYGIKVLEVFHDAPTWTGAVRDRLKNDFYPYPRNLIASANSWQNIGQKWTTLWNGLEVWNEPEIAFGGAMPGDQVSALQKVISYEFKTNNIQTPVISGVFTGSVVNDRMMRLFIQNGLLSDADIMSFHTYAPTERVESLIAEYRHVLRNNPKQGIPLWITESGMPWPTGTSRALKNDDIHSAMHITMKAIESKACGIDMFYPFIMQFYEEHTKNFGMMDRFHTPMRSLAGYLNLVQKLSNYNYEGDFSYKTGGKINRVFKKGNSAMLIIYTGDQRSLIKLPSNIAAVANAYGIDGRSLPKKDEYLESDGMLYFEIPFAKISSYVNKETGAKDLLDIAQNYQPVPRSAKPIVLQYDFDRNTTSWTLYGYMFNNPSKALLPIAFNNLSDQELTIRPKLDLPAAVKILSPLPEQLTIPPRSVTKANVLLDLEKAFAQNNELDIVIKDLNNNADSMLIGVRAWNLEEIKVASGLTQKLPENFDDIDTSWTVLESVERWKRWEGNHLPTIKAAFNLSYTPDTMQLLVLVHDQKFYQPFDIAQAWQADSVQLGIQQLDEIGQRKQPFTEVTAAQTPSGAKVFRHSCESGKRDRSGILKNSTLEFKQISSNLFLYVIKLDAKELGITEFTKDKLFGSSLLINASEGKQRDGYLYWGDGIGENKNAREFNVLRLN